MRWTVKQRQSIEKAMTAMKHGEVNAFYSPDGDKWEVVRRNHYWILYKCNPESAIFRIIGKYGAANLVLGYIVGQQTTAPSAARATGNSPPKPHQ